MTPRQIGDRYRREIAKSLSKTCGTIWRQKTWLKSHHSNYLVRYSKNNNDGYWYGIEKGDCENWCEKDHLIFLLPR